MTVLAWIRESSPDANTTPQGDDQGVRAASFLDHEGYYRVLAASPENSGRPSRMHGDGEIPHDVESFRNAKQYQANQQAAEGRA